MTKKQKQITVTRKQAIEILTDLGFKEIRKADNESLERRLGKMKLYLESFKGTFNGEMKALSTKVIKAGKGNITVVGDEPKTSKATKTKTKSGKGKSKEKKAKATTKKEKTGVDAFGSRLGTVRAKVNAMLSKKKPMTMTIIREKLGGPCNESYLKGLVERKLVVKTEKGYKLK